MTSTTARQLAWSALIVLHIAAGVSSEARDQPWARPVYELLRPAQASLALWQNWAMFSPPPRTTSALEASGRLPRGTWIPLDLLPRGHGEPHTVSVRYDRFGKLERSAFKGSRKKLQRGIAHWVCRQARLAGTPVQQVQLRQHRRWIPRPDQRGSETPREDRDDLRRVVCK